MTTFGVFLGGEGSNELGSRAREPVWQTDEEPGVLQTLLRRVRDQGWEVAGATQWSKIPKLAARRPQPTEERNVLGLVLEATRAKASAVAFLRDADDDPERPAVIEAAIVKARQVFPQIQIIGGTARPVLEGWLLALRGEHGSEQLGKTAAQRRLAEAGVPGKNTAAMVAVVESAALLRVPRDATSLIAWLRVAEAVLPGAGTAEPSEPAEDAT